MNDKVKILQLSYGNYVSADDYFKLQSNWNSLREFVIQLQKLKGINQQGFSWGVAQEVIDKMNELEKRNESNGK